MIMCIFIYKYIADKAPYRPILVLKNGVDSLFFLSQTATWTA